MRTHWLGSEFPSRIVLDAQASSETYGSFTFEPFDRQIEAFVCTDLSQILQDYSESASVAHVETKKIEYQFSSPPSVMQNVTDIVRDIKSWGVRMDANAILKRGSDVDDWAASAPRLELLRERLHGGVRSRDGREAAQYRYDRKQCGIVFLTKLDIEADASLWSDHSDMDRPASVSRGAGNGFEWLRLYPVEGERADRADLVRCYDRADEYPWNLWTAQDVSARPLAESEGEMGLSSGVEGGRRPNQMVKVLDDGRIDGGTSERNCRNHRSERGFCPTNRNVAGRPVRRGACRGSLRRWTGCCRGVTHADGQGNRIIGNDRVWCWRPSVNDGVSEFLWRTDIRHGHTTSARTTPMWLFCADVESLTGDYRANYN